MEKHVYVGFPKKNDIIEILTVGLKQLKCIPLHHNAHICAGGGGGEFDAVLDAIAGDPRASSLTPADLSALVKTAFLAAAQELINGNAYDSDREGDGGGGGVGSTSVNNTSASTSSQRVLEPRHLLEAFHQTRSSISETDRAFYEGIYGRFRGSSSGPAEFPAAEASAFDVTQQRSTLV